MMRARSPTPSRRSSRPRSAATTGRSPSPPSTSTISTPSDGAARFTAIANAIANNLHAPDILSIEEMQDNNGAIAGDGISPTGSDASTTWQMLVDALNLATGAHYQWVDQAPVYNAEGGEPNGNIRVGFIYNTDRVQLGDLAPDATLAERREYVDRIGDGFRDAGDLIQFSDDMLGAEINTNDWTNTRKSLLGQFTFHGNTVFVTANHFPAKGGSGAFWQFDQTLENGEPNNSGLGAAQPGRAGRLFDAQPGADRGARCRHRLGRRL